MKAEVMHKLVAAEQAVTRLFDALDNELRDCDEYAVEALECEDLIASKHAARAALIHIRTAIATVRMVSDEIAADLAAEELASQIGMLEDAPYREPEFDDPNT
jgi:hypothetical protein